MEVLQEMMLRENMQDPEKMYIVYYLHVRKKHVCFVVNDWTVSGKRHNKHRVVVWCLRGEHGTGLLFRLVGSDFQR